MKTTNALPNMDVIYSRRRCLIYARQPSGQLVVQWKAPPPQHIVVSRTQLNRIGGGDGNEMVGSVNLLSGSHHMEKTASAHPINCRTIHVFHRFSTLILYRISAGGERRDYQVFADLQASRKASIFSSGVLTSMPTQEMEILPSEALPSRSIRATFSWIWSEVSFWISTAL